MTTPLIHRLVQSARLGQVQEDDFRELFELYRHRVWISFPKDATSREDRDELTQETFLAVYKGLRRCPEDAFEEPDAFERWLHKIAKNVFLTWVQRKGRLKRTRNEISLESLMASDTQVAEPLGKSAVNGMVEEEQSRILHAAIAELPDQRRRCIRLQLEQELSIRDIADVLRLSQGAVKAHIHQAKQQLKSRLAELSADVETGGNASG